MSIYSHAIRRRPQACRVICGLRTVFGAFVTLVVFVFSFPTARAAIGTLHIVRQVLVTRGSVAAGQVPSYSYAHEGQGVDSGEGVRTLKRSQAQIDFHDGSVLRVNERTDLIVEDTASLRNFHLNSGVVWVRVAKGVQTQVETPSATAVARGTVFTVSYSSNGNTVLEVFEGVVDLTAMGGATVSVSEGQTITVTPTNTTPVAYTIPPTARNLRPNELPVEYGGGTYGWWRSVEADLGVVVTPGTDAISDLRTSPVGEAIQELAQGGPNTNTSPNSFYFSDLAERTLLFQNAQAVTVGDIDNSGLSPSQYAKNFGNNSLAASGFSPNQIAALNTLGITTVGQAIQALSANGASLNISVPVGRTTQPASVSARSAYDFQQVRGGQPNYDYRLLDQNETSLSFVGIGAALALFADTGHMSVPTPTLTAQAFGFENDPSLFGGRAAIDGYISGRTHYTLEGNAIRVLTGADVGTYTKPDSVAVVEQSLTDNVTVFAGRQRFYEGPVFQDEVSSQMIADRYTGAGLSYKTRGIQLDGAYLYDSNPDVIGAQHGALASIRGNFAGGVVGINYLRTVDLDQGNGFTADLTYPLLPGVVDVYTEAGRGPDHATLQTYGAYLPGLYQKMDIDLFLEYGYHEGLGHALSLTGNRDIGRNFAIRAYVSALGDGSNDIKGGIAGIFKFSAR